MRYIHDSEGVYGNISYITQQKHKYNYGYKMGTRRLRKQMIMLPITDEGSPDYEYMEQYIKAVMFGKYKKYLVYAQS